MLRATLFFALWLGRPGSVWRSLRRSQFITCSHCGLRNEGLLMPIMRATLKSPVLHLMLACLAGSMVMFAVVRLLK